MVCRWRMRFPLQCRATLALQMKTEATINTPPAEKRSPFLDFPGLCARVPYSPRALRSLVKRGDIPSIRLRNCRKLLFDWQAVENALRRHAKGGDV